MKKIERGIRTALERGGAKGITFAVGSKHPKVEFTRPDGSRVCRMFPRSPRDDADVYAGRLVRKWLQEPA